MWLDTVKLKHVTLTKYLEIFSISFTVVASLLIKLQFLLPSRLQLMLSITAMAFQFPQKDLHSPIQRFPFWERCIG